MMWDIRLTERRIVDMQEMSAGEVWSRELLACTE